MDATVFLGSSGSGRTFHVCDIATRRRFLVDTGVQISVVPPTAADRRSPSPGLHLQAANCSPIPTFGSLSLTLNIGLRRHPKICNPRVRSGEVQHDVVHHIRISGPPVFARLRRLPPERFQTAKAEFEHMLQLGIIRPSESPWASPLHMVPKAKSGDWRPCGDYRALLCATITDRYPLRHDQDLVGALFGEAVFSKIDLVHAFHQIPVAPEDTPKTTVTTPFGVFEFIRMPFGFLYAAQTFQRFIGHVLHGLPFVYSYIDDLLVVEAVRNFPTPTSKRDLQRFLGMVSFYRRFLLNCSDLMLPLTNMLSGPKGALELTGEALTAFDRIKNSPADATLLTHPAREAQLSLMVDASTVAVGAVDGSSAYASGPDHAFDRLLLDMTLRLFLTQHVCFPTRVREGQQSNCLDLLLTKSLDSIDEVQCLPPLGRSDQVVLLWEYSIFSLPEQATRVRRNIWSGDFAQMKAELNTVN
ncbi:hypothetical protein SprV_0401694500 [Sparganum proliferum]